MWMCFVSLPDDQQAFQQPSMGHVKLAGLNFLRRWEESMSVVKILVGKGIMQSGWVGLKLWEAK